MHQTIEAIIHPDGTIEVLEPIHSRIARRALLTILDEPPSLSPQDQPDEEIEAALWASGVFVMPDDISKELTPLSEDQRIALAQRIPKGTPLSHIIIEDREERF